MSTFESSADRRNIDKNKPNTANNNITAKSLPNTSNVTTLTLGQTKTLDKQTQTAPTTEIKRTSQPQAIVKNTKKGSHRLKTFSSFRHRNFRMFWGGAFVSNIGNWMQTVAQNWLVLSLTHSAFLLGLVSFIGNAPILVLGLFGGVVADRSSRKRVLLLTQNMMCLLTMALAVLTWLNLINIWLVIIIALSIGIVSAFNSPAYQTIMLDLVEREDLMNAIALNSMQFNLTRIIGPSIAGALVVAVGTAMCFFFNSLSFLAVVVALLFIKLPAAKPKPEKKVWSEIREGLAYLRQNKPLAVIIGLGTASNLFMFPYLTLLPVFAKEVFHSDAGDYGLLLAAVGVGAAIGSVGVASLSDKGTKSRLIMFGAGLVVVTLIGFALSNQLWLSLLILPFVGAAMVVLNSALMTLVQTEAPDNLRGRIISISTLTSFGVLPIGNLLAGTVAELCGAPFAVCMNAVIFGLIISGAYLVMPKLRQY
jgi:MFS family permease